jgi:hypothetical protein
MIKIFLHIFLSRLAKLCPNNLFKPAFVAVEAIVLFALLCTLIQTSESTGNECDYLIMNECDNDNNS